VDKHIVCVKERFQTIGHPNTPQGLRQMQRFHVGKLLEQAAANLRDLVADRYCGGGFLPAFIPAPGFGIFRTNAAPTLNDQFPKAAFNEQQPIMIF
jgi:hypothetical protein